MEQHTEGAVLESGQTMAEYAVVLTVITVALVAAFGVLNSAVLSLIVRATSAI